MVAFWDAISDERLLNTFRFEDQDFLNRVKIVLGDEYMRVEFKYRTNMDIASMFTAWAFELLGVDQVHWLISNSVKEEWRGDLTGFIKMARNEEGFVFLNGVWLHSCDFQHPLRSFLLWSVNCSKEFHRALAQIGMQGVQDYIRL